jgi:hypothetical protein
MEIKPAYGTTRARGADLSYREIEAAAQAILATGIRPTVGGSRVGCRPQGSACAAANRSHETEGGRRRPEGRQNRRRIAQYILHNAIAVNELRPIHRRLSEYPEAARAVVQAAHNLFTLY